MFWTNEGIVTERMDCQSYQSKMEANKNKIKDKSRGIALRDNDVEGTLMGYFENL